MTIDPSRIGLSAPVLVLQPGAFSPWETTASFHHVT
jgi:hypothetical protein